MQQLMKSGDVVVEEGSGGRCTARRYLGGGGQGEVYQAELDGQDVALKWYHPHYLDADPTLRQRLTNALRRGAPSDRFLWPMQIVTNAGGAFGYVMPLREGRFKGLVDLMTQRVDPSFAALATAGFELAHNYFLLHARGLCYRDISFGNVFFDPSSGEVRICDTDNVDVNGSQGAVHGTPDFMAPELVRNEARPSTETDLYSLAVLLFYMLHIHHPLDGRKKLAIHSWDLPARRRLYGEQPVFIFDPNDPSNAAVPRSEDPSGEGGANAVLYWQIYPQFLRDLFIRAFTKGLHDPAHGRVRESEWRAAMVRLRDSVLYCRCGKQNFYDAQRVQGGSPGACWCCGRTLPLPFRIKLGREVVMLNADTNLYPHHLDETARWDFTRPLAKVVQHPSSPGVWGLENMGSEKWTITLPDQTVKDVVPGRRLQLASGVRIHFGRANGEIRG
jgi:eukaryotic-like serine/threonine-protein kinase